MFGRKNERRRVSVSRAASDPCGENCRTRISRRGVREKHVENKHAVFLRGLKNLFSKNSRSKKRSSLVLFLSFPRRENVSVSFERVLRGHRRNSHRLPPPRVSVIVRVIGRGMRDTRSYYML